MRYFLYIFFIFLLYKELWALSVGAKAEGLMTAYTAKSEGIYSYLNPGGIIFSQYKEIIASYKQRSYKQRSLFLGYIFNIKELGFLQISYLYKKNIEEELGFSYGVELRKQIGIGVNIKSLYIKKKNKDNIKNKDNHERPISVDIGSLIKLDPHTNLALVLKDVSSPPNRERALIFGISHKVAENIEIMTDFYNFKKVCLGLEFKTKNFGIVWGISSGESISSRESISSGNRDNNISAGLSFCIFLNKEKGIEFDYALIPNYHIFSCLLREKII